MVYGGRGVGNPDRFSTTKKLEAALNGEIGASRVVLDEGWIDKSHQLGQTGKTVKPKVYIACGISGVIQYRAGMVNSDIIIAINTDPEAPILKFVIAGL
ncbi:MAG: FAD-binding protein [Halanaerobiales bacterium]